MMTDSLPMESSQETQETPVLFSKSGTWSNVPDDVPINVEHADTEKSQRTTLIMPGDHVFTPQGRRNPKGPSKLRLGTMCVYLLLSN